MAEMGDMVGLRDFVEGEYGRLDALVNCAADNLWKVFEDTTVEEWDRSIGINLRAPFVLSKLFLPLMKGQGGGSIVNISSGSATRGFVAEVGYCPSKYGLEGLTQVLAMEFYQYNIAVNSLSPSAPEGLKLRPSRLTPEGRKICLRRLGLVSLTMKVWLRRSPRLGASSRYRTPGV